MIDDFLCLSIFKLVINSVFLEGGFGLFIDIKLNKEFFNFVKISNLKLNLVNN